MRLIDADALLESTKRNCVGNCRKCENQTFLSSDIHCGVIDEQPTIEAVPVVHCKDCKYRTWFCPGYGCGNYNSPFYLGADEEVPIMTRPDDFCSYGEKNIDKKKGV